MVISALTQHDGKPIYTGMAKQKNNDAAELIREWPLPPSATLGSSVRAKGILLELRARMPSAVRKALELEAGALVLTMPESAKGEFRFVSALVAEALKGIESLPVIPREIQDILTISTTERHRWLNDGRLPSAGTRTVRLRGRAKQITFHVFGPRIVEDLLDRGIVEDWREEDAITRAENRQRAAWKAKVTRSLKSGNSPPSSAGTADANVSDLPGWDEFGRDGLLR